jgi:hypothetical protein
MEKAAAPGCMLRDNGFILSQCAGFDQQQRGILADAHGDTGKHLLEFLAELGGQHPSANRPEHRPGDDPHAVDEWTYPYQNQET